MRESTKELYLKCLNDIYSDSQKNGVVRSVVSYPKMYGISNSIVTDLIKLGYLKKQEGRSYSWAGRTPDETMILEIRKKQNELIEGGKVKNANSLFKVKRTRLTPIPAIFDIVIEYSLLADKYNVPVDQKKAFMMDIHKLRSKISHDTERIR